MVDKIKKLDGVKCLGENMRVRRINEETVQTNAQAAAIALAALKSLTYGNTNAGGNSNEIINS